MCKLGRPIFIFHYSLFCFWFFFTNNIPLLEVHAAINNVDMLLTAMRGHKGHCMSLAAIKITSFVDNYHRCRFCLGHLSQPG